MGSIFSSAVQLPPNPKISINCACFRGEVLDLVDGEVEGESEEAKDK